MVVKNCFEVVVLGWWLGLPPHPILKFTENSQLPLLYLFFSLNVPSQKKPTKTQQQKASPQVLSSPQVDPPPQETPRTFSGSSRTAWGDGTCARSPWPHWPEIQEGWRMFNFQGDVGWWWLMNCNCSRPLRSALRYKLFWREITPNFYQLWSSFLKSSFLWTFSPFGISEGSSLLKADPKDLCELSSSQVSGLTRPTSTIVPKGVGHSRSVQDGRMDATQGHLGHVNAFEGGVTGRHNRTQNMKLFSLPSNPPKKCPKKQNRTFCRVHQRVNCWVLIGDTTMTNIFF